MKPREVESLGNLLGLGPNGGQTLFNWADSIQNPASHDPLASTQLDHSQLDHYCAIILYFAPKKILEGELKHQLMEGIKGRNRIWRAVVEVGASVLAHILPSRDIIGMIWAITSDPQDTIHEVTLRAESAARIIKA